MTQRKDNFNNFPDNLANTEHASRRFADSFLVNFNCAGERIKDDSGKSLRPEQKSVAEMTRFVLQFSRLGGVVFDPFCGSGSTAIAALENDRRVVCLDNDPAAIHATRARLAAWCQANARAPDGTKRGHD